MTRSCQHCRKQILNGFFDWLVALQLMNTKFHPESGRNNIFRLWQISQTSTRRQNNTAFCDTCLKSWMPSVTDGCQNWNSSCTFFMWNTCRAFLMILLNKAQWVKIKNITPSFIYMKCIYCQTFPFYIPIPGSISSNELWVQGQLEWEWKYKNKHIFCFLKGILFLVQ